MKHTYNYDDVYGVLLEKDKEDTTRIYFVGESQCYSFYKWMFKHGWHKVVKIEYELGKVFGYKITLSK